MSKKRKELEKVAALLREENTLALATVGEQGQACVAPLYYIADEDLTLFWLSSESSLHSRNLKREPMAAATVYRHTDNWKEIRGVQLRGPVSVVSDPEGRRALVEAYCERFQLGLLFKAAISQCSVYALRPVFFRSVDNSSVFGQKIEIELEDE
jgi:uncharacterized protein YhbP (UPF0306 family)